MCMQVIFLTIQSILLLLLKSLKEVFLHRCSHIFSQKCSHILLSFDTSSTPCKGRHTSNRILTLYSQFQSIEPCNHMVKSSFGHSSVLRRADKWLFLLPLLFPLWPIVCHSNFLGGCKALLH